MHEARQRRVPPRPAPPRPPRLPRPASRDPQLHWSEFPSKLCASLEEHAAKGALVFSGVGFFDVGLAVLTRRWGFLRRHLVRYSAALAAMSDEEVTGMLRGRLAPVRR